jgi:5-methylcytosine-specific restriction endonuclease McrA
MKQDKSKIVKTNKKSTTRPQIPQKIQNALWARAGGRCEFEGCNDLLCEDWLTGKTINGAQAAHILPVAHSARHKEGQGESSKTDIDNLMLICYKHHNLIDKSSPEEYPEKKLLEMKQMHEARIKRATAVQEDKQTLVLLYGANIDRDKPLLDYRSAQLAISPEFYVSEPSPVKIQISSEIRETDPEYWTMEKKNLIRSIKQKVLDHIGDSGYEQVSIFALGPQPLLVELGVLLNEKYPVRVFQKIRIPDTWRWQDDCEIELRVKEPGDSSKQPVLIIAISGADIIKRTFGFYKGEASIWVLTADNPNMNIMKSESQLEKFRDCSRKLLELITTKTEFDTIQVHMAMPNSCAVEFGRVWMPKVHKNLLLFENKKDCIVKTLKIENQDDTRTD